MQAEILNINLLDVDKNYILISTTPSMPCLKKDDIELFYGDNLYTDFEISDESEGLCKVYRLILNLLFTQHDYISLRIVKEGYKSNLILHYMSRCFKNHTANFSFNLPADNYKTFRINGIKVNGVMFNLSSEVQRISQPLDTVCSSAALIGNGTYVVDENIFIDVELHDANGNKVPDGYYSIEIYTEQIEPV